MASPSYNYLDGIDLCYIGNIIFCVLCDFKEPGPVNLFVMKKTFWFLIFLVILSPVSLFPQLRQHSSLRTNKASSKLVQEDFKVYGNPANSKIKIVFQSNELTNGVLMIYFSDGRLLAQKKLSINKGINTWEYRFPPSATGEFLIKLRTKKIERTTRVEKTLHSAGKK